MACPANHPLCVPYTAPNWNSVSPSPAQRRLANKMSAQLAVDSKAAFWVLASSLPLGGHHSWTPQASLDHRTTFTTSTTNSVSHCQLSVPTPEYDSWCGNKPSLLRVGTEVSTTLRRKRTIRSWKQFIPCNLTSLFLETGYIESATYVPRRNAKRRLFLYFITAKNEKEPILGLLKKH